VAALQRAGADAGLPDHEATHLSYHDFRHAALMDRIPSRTYSAEGIPRARISAISDALARLLRGDKDLAAMMPDAFAERRRQVELTRICGAHSPHETF
jgi:hypothetical protein